MVRILVVDDDESVHKFLIDTLTYAGYDTLSALDGLMGVQMASENLPDLIISDVNMPRMDGVTFVRSLRGSANEIASLPALMISTEAETQDRSEAQASGANFYLVKPVAEAELVRHVCALTGAPL